jgi:DNA modification methylase
LIAAVSNSRKGIGIDVDRKYCELAHKRILESTEPVQVELPRKKVVKKKIAADKNG